MKGRRTAAMLCVLLGHALVVFVLMNLTRVQKRPMQQAEAFVGEMVFIVPDIEDRSSIDPLKSRDSQEIHLETPLLSSDQAEGATEGVSEPEAERGYTDWPKEGRDAAARVLAREAETERVAKMFAGPQGTWASLTKRQQSELNHFRWKPGVAGLERDEKGNTILHVSAGCTLVNFTMIACALGKKPPPYGDMFKDMRLYFDEQRRPQTDEGNGREPESMRPPYWSKPLE